MPMPEAKTGLSGVMSLGTGAGATARHRVSNGLAQGLVKAH